MKNEKKIHHCFVVSLIKRKNKHKKKRKKERKKLFSLKICVERTLENLFLLLLPV